MAVTAVIGAQWGDEGKGKLVHLISADCDIVLRYQGGSNAGHTVKVDGQTFKFSLLPSAIIRPGKRCLICDGVVVNVVTLAEEIRELQRLNCLRGALTISRHAHLVLPYHCVQDRYFEQAKGADAIGTTLRGIGPAYADKYFRVGLRAGDMLKADFGERVKAAAQRKNVLFKDYYRQPEVDPAQAWDEVRPAIELLAPLVGDTGSIVQRGLEDGARIMCEGAQGTLLDIDSGTYPYVTSSHPISGGAFLGTGLSWRDIESVIGVTKAYTTRVGAGPFPTEELGTDGEQMRQAGMEYGTVTGRPRRCGWLDLPLLRYAAQLSGFTELAVTKTDVLDGFKEIKVCVDYRLDGARVDWPDLDPAVLATYTQVYETLPGWHCDTSQITREQDLPKRFLNFIDYIQQQVGVPVRIISVGPDAAATIYR